MPDPSARAWHLLLAGASLALGLLAGRADAAPPAFEDTIAQRTLACTACHGEQGRAGPDGYYPRLAGKPAGYLYNQLLNFRDGRRHYGLMTRMVELLSDDYLAEIARHFAAMDVPYPPPTAAVRADRAALERGRQLALHGDPAARLPACAQCHGRHLMGVQPRFPALLGLPADYLTAQLGGWRTGQRQAHAPDCMREVVRRLSDADAHAVVTWLAGQPVPDDHAPATQRPDASSLAPDLDCGGTPLAGVRP
ncbi:MAG TPA: c-type cytochrome [Ottowia sp.]|uniref:c-type cytochrome n=1 Tax=Ottowia sp. TaxID=1898956 RepID=UPI002D0F4D3E|nr:c-type cytochrome [Ottowia sp.]HMN20615.1 c-type cytochrome [Ottowia sp.]